MRKKSTASFLLGLLILLFACERSYASGLGVISDRIVDAEKLIQEKGAKYGVDKVLVVFDIDHTLLAPWSDLGTAYWFKWQLDLIKTPEHEPEQLAASVAELKQLNSRILCAIQFRPVEEQSVPTYSRILSQKFPVILLTARAPDLREPTERELKLNQFALPSWMNAESLGADSKGGEDLRLESLTSNAIVFGDQRRITYRNGILMTSGEDKAAVLKSLLRQLQPINNIKAIVLIDDSKENCASLERAYGAQSSDIDVTTFLYTKEHPRFDEFMKGDHWTAIAEWRRIVEDSSFRNKVCH